jgi:hypothetical protein
MYLSSAVLERDSTFAPGGGEGGPTITPRREEIRALLLSEFKLRDFFAREGGGGVREKNLKRRFLHPRIWKHESGGVAKKKLLRHSMNILDEERQEGNEPDM